MYSWYKYARLLNISHDAYRKTTKLTGLIAQKPNEYLQGCVSNNNSKK